MQAHVLFRRLKQFGNLSLRQPNSAIRGAKLDLGRSIVRTV
jgi:hypothetical protein